MAATRYVWVIPSFLIWGYVLHVGHVSCVITNFGQHERVTPSLSSITLYAFLEENTTIKLLSLSLDLFLKILFIQVPFHIFCFITILSLLSSGWFVIAICGSVSARELVKWLKCFANWCRVAVFHDKSTWWIPSLFCVSFLSIFLKLIVICRMWVIYVREDNGSNI